MIRADKWLEWVYERKEGDIEVFAPTKEDALRTIAEHGFIGINPDKLKMAKRKLSDILKKEGIK